MENTIPSYPQIIEQSSASLVIAISDTEVGKIQLPNKLVFVDVHTGKPVDFLGEEPRVLKNNVGCHPDGCFFPLRIMHYAPC